MIPVTTVRARARCHWRLRYLEALDRGVHVVTVTSRANSALVAVGRGRTRRLARREAFDGLRRRLRRPRRTELLCV